MKRALDLGCGAGGATRGYQLAGYYVVGVDTAPQPNYVGDEFHQADMLEYPLDGFDLIHVSPPCQDHSPLSALVGKHGTGYLLAAIRERLQAQPTPWVIENVPGAPMRADLRLCGKMFRSAATGRTLRVQRHRWIEIDPRAMIPGQPEHPRHDMPTATRQRRQRWAEGWDVSITGDVGTYLGPAAMDIDWMTGDELSQAIPPAYTRMIGEAFR